tara:strand:+ start:153 stop:419 length:267 start_codon:yes stop_codon:yes gene_type:complete
MKGLLTRKQLWRKTITYNFYKNEENIENVENIKDKSVHFDNIVSVVLIPERKELSHLLSDKLWYSQDDYFGFAQDKENELLKSKYHSF